MPGYAGQFKLSTSTIFRFNISTSTTDRIISTDPGSSLLVEHSTSTPSIGKFKWAAGDYIILEKRTPSTSSGNLFLSCDGTVKGTAKAKCENATSTNDGIAETLQIFYHYKP